MEQKLFLDKPKIQRKHMLEDNCDKIEEIDYVQRLDDAEIDQRKSDFAKISVKYQRLEDELKEIQASFKEEMKPINKERLQLLNEIKLGVIEAHGKVYTFIDHEAEMRVHTTRKVFSFPPVLQTKRNYHN